MFLHGGWLHLLGNMLFLLIFGNNVEDRLGPPRGSRCSTSLCGYAASYGFALFNADSSRPADRRVGGDRRGAGRLSGAVSRRPGCGCLVPFLVFLPLRLPAWLVLGFWFALQAVYSSGEGVSAVGTVAYAAHVVGFLAGHAARLAAEAGHSPAAGAARSAVRQDGRGPGTRGDPVSGRSACGRTPRGGSARPGRWTAARRGRG